VPQFAPQTSLEQFVTEMANFTRLVLRLSSSCLWSSMFDGGFDIRLMARPSIAVPCA
jgi:hypothetical protein